MEGYHSYCVPLPLVTVFAEAKAGPGHPTVLVLACLEGAHPAQGALGGPCCTPSCTHFPTSEPPVLSGLPSPPSEDTLLSELPVHSANGSGPCPCVPPHSLPLNPRGLGAVILTCI